MPSEQADGQTPHGEQQKLSDTLSAKVPPTEIREIAVSDWLPSRPPPLSPTAALPPDLTQLEPGQRLGDFLIRRVLGRGGFAAVYLALQWSLDREVALKVTSPQPWMSGSDSAARVAGEGQYLAQLDHPHIVRVYQQMIEPHTGAQLLCMQYVAGTTLERLIERLRDRAGQWSGRDFLAAIEQETPLPPTSDVPLLARSDLAQADHLETICRLGSQLATALEHAHRRGVVHRDIKPANVLVNRHGQPLLADFNLASSRTGAGGSGLIGGTLAYMSPEQLEAFRLKTPSANLSTDQLGDIYSLGVLLWQTSSGQLPFPLDRASGAGASGSERLTALLQFRCETPVSEWGGSERFWPQLMTKERPESAATGDLPVRSAGQYSSQAMLGAILAKAMHPSPQRRYRSARCFGKTLVGLAELHRARRSPASESRLAAAARQYPVAALLLAGLLPQLIASLLQVTYNVSRVLDHFQPAQTTAFVQLVWWTNPVIYGGCLVVFVRYLWHVLPAWQRLQRADPTLTAREVDRARNEALRLPRRAATIAGVGWLIGALVFPAGVMLLGGPLPWAVLLHFLMSFLLAGLISVTYSAFALATVVLRLFYLPFWLTPRHFRRRAASELRPLDQRLETITLLAGTIPLAAATAFLFAGPRDDNDAATFGFRLLAVLLILAGGAGFSMAGRVVGNLRARIRSWVEVAANEAPAG